MEAKEVGGNIVCPERGVIMGILQTPGDYNGEMHQPIGNATHWVLFPNRTGSSYLGTGNSFLGKFITKGGDPSMNEYLLANICL